jgi:hypothetical protein
MLFGIWRVLKTPKSGKATFFSRQGGHVSRQDGQILLWVTSQDLKDIGAAPMLADEAPSGNDHSLIANQ